MRQRQSSKSSLDAILDVLTDGDRRRLLVALLERNSQDRPSLQLPDDIALEEEQLESLDVRMHHVHLPKLEEAGLIEWDRATNEVQRGPQFEEVRPLLAPIRDQIEGVLEE
ncbi:MULTISPECIES: DUF7344 domain-containing protein [Natrialbaceae]|uniref:DUF7344 domain-containing protein n=1 Tax=Natrialbaceae TaxID=1644061 RepID=UPI00207C1181|nr:ArsR family transcriptional regulator [Natronococcus sp. CG52]